MIATRSVFGWEQDSGQSLAFLPLYPLTLLRYWRRSFGEHGGHCLGLGCLKKLPFSGLGQYEKDQFKSL